MEPSELTVTPEAARTFISAKARIGLGLRLGVRIKKHTRLLIQAQRIAIRILMTSEAQGGGDGRRIGDSLINDSDSK